MVCVGCQQRREAIRQAALKVGTVVFGGRGRKLAANFLDGDRKKGDPAGLDPSASAAGVRADGLASPGRDAGAAGAAGTQGYDGRGGD